MVKKACAAEGMEFEFAFMLDALLEEQKQNVTIDTTQIPFRTARRRTGFTNRRAGFNHRLLRIFVSE